LRSVSVDDVQAAVDELRADGAEFDDAGELEETPVCFMHSENTPRENAPLHAFMLVCRVIIGYQTGSQGVLGGQFLECRLTVDEAFRSQRMSGKHRAVPSGEKRGGVAFMNSRRCQDRMPEWRCW
jgi:hypothetical protein